VGYLHVLVHLEPYVLRVEDLESHKVRTNNLG